MRLVSEVVLREAILVSCKDGIITMVLNEKKPAAMAQGGRILISDFDDEYYAEITDIEGNQITAGCMSREKREYFRVDDIFPITITKIAEGLSCRKSRILACFGRDGEETELPEGVNPRLWNMLVSINARLGLVMEELALKREGIGSAAPRKVNISAAGLRCRGEEKIVPGDLVELKMVLPAAPPVALQTYGRVIRVNGPGEGECEFAISFIDIGEDVRDEIIRYAFKRQRELIRERRAKEGNAPR